MILYDSTGKPHVIRVAYPEPTEPPELPVALYRVQGSRTRLRFLRRTANPVQLIRNQQVSGSSPLIGSITSTNSVV